MVEAAPSWGNSCPTWGDVRSAAQHRCGCPAPAQPAPVSCCWQSPTGCTHALQVAPGLGVVRCALVRLRRARAGKLQSLYLASPGEPHFLCPDCLWVWAEAWLNCPSQRSVVLSDPELTIHMHNLAGTCSEGAGANSTSDHTSFPSLPVDAPSHQRHAPATLPAVGSSAHNLRPCHGPWRPWSVILRIQRAHGTQCQCLVPRR